MKHSLVIEHLNLMGAGVGRLEGKTFFFKGALPGDRVEFEMGDPTRQGQALEVKDFKVVAPSEDRVESNCVYSHECGGCDWIELDYAQQVEQKEKILKYVLQRNQIVPQKWFPFVSADETWFYRSRIQMHIQDNSWGFYKRGTHDLVEVRECKVAMRGINEYLKNWNPQISPTQTKKRVTLAIDALGKVVECETEQDSSLSFSQVHWGQNEKLKRLVQTSLDALGSKGVLELFSGSGNLTTSYLAKVNRVVMVEEDLKAVLSAREKFKELDHVTVYGMRVNKKTVSKLKKFLEPQIDTLLLDPPRSGTGDIYTSLLEGGLKHIVYVSCSPLSFSIDARLILSKGFSLLSVQGIDMFPQTRHIELVAVFSRCG